MPPVIIVAIVVAAAVVVLVAHARWRRTKLVTRLRDAWGKARPVAAAGDDRADGMWREVGAADAVAIDPRTWADLDLDRVLATIDRTQTALGRQVLYWRIRSGAAWTASPAQEGLTARFGADPAFRERIGVLLASAGQSLGDGLWVITRAEPIRIRWWYWTFPLLAIAMVASIAAMPFAPRALLVVAALAVLNMAVRMATAWQVPGLLAPMRQMAPLIRTAERLVHAGDVAESDDLIASDVERLRPLRRVAQWVSRDTLASGDIVASFWEYLNLLFILDANALLFSAHRLRELSPVLGRVATWVGNVDVARSVASLRAEPGPWSQPQWTRVVTTSVAAAWHPLIDHPVANDIELRAGSGVIVTGANMSGKSTYLRTVGIAAVLARAINTCPAASWRGRAVIVRSLIGRGDDLAAGKSYYQVEADGVVQLLRDAAATAPTLFLLDELLRGTNTIERLAAGDAVLRALLGGAAGTLPHVVIVATHDGELVSMLNDLYTPIHFRETIGPGGLSFDYRRREGPASTRTAIALLEATGAPPSVISAARARAEELERSIRPPR